MDPEKLNRIERAMRNAMHILEQSEKFKKREAADALGHALSDLSDIQESLPPCSRCGVALATPADCLCDICRERDPFKPLPNAARQLGYPAWLSEALNSGDGTYKP